jgi:hypothetical protein
MAVVGLELLLHQRRAILAALARRATSDARYLAAEVSS